MARDFICDLSKFLRKEQPPAHATATPSNECLTPKVLAGSKKEKFASISKSVATRKKVSFSGAPTHIVNSNRMLLRSKINIRVCKLLGTAGAGSI
jgi:hypothetical protein